MRAVPEVTWSAPPLTETAVPVRPHGETRAEENVSWTTTGGG